MLTMVVNTTQRYVSNSCVITEKQDEEASWQGGWLKQDNNTRENYCLLHMIWGQTICRYSSSEDGDYARFGSRRVGALASDVEP